jgi:hypothetical protein
MEPPALSRDPRVERPSLREYLSTRLTQAERQHVLLTSFNHWDFAMAAVAETALCLREMGSPVSVALWADQTPMHDEGWQAGRWVSRALLTNAPDANLERGLVRMGIPPEAFVDPPIRDWRPVEPIHVPRPLNRSQIRALTYRGTPMGKAILQVHPDRNTPITDEHYWPRRWLARAARSYAFVLDQTLALIERRGVTAALAFNGRFLHDRAVAEAAALAGIPLLSTDLGGTDADFDLTIEPTHDWSTFQRRVVEIFDGWDPEERVEIGSSWFLDRVQHKDPQNALFVEAQRRGEMVDIPEGATVVAFFSSSGDEMAELEFDWSEYFGGQGSALRTLADVCRSRPDTLLVVRSHPHKRIKPARDVEEWLADVAAAAPDIHLDPYSPIDSYSLMRRADIVVTYGSTTGIEAAFARKPVIVMGPSAYGELDCVMAVHSPEELARALDTAAPGEWNSAVAFGLMMRKRGFRVERIERQPGGGYRVGGIALGDVRPAARHASHLLDRVQRAHLRRK